jgi:DeoR/GlpR family transcriptional regulator of sugar metabolism
MRRSDRLFDIVQRLRTASKPTTAAELAADLEGTPRTVYRDIAALQGRRSYLRNPNAVHRTCGRAARRPGSISGAAVVR